jgi:IS30 family transposase
VFGEFWRYPMSENMHLTLDERNYIEQELMKNTSFKEIAHYLGKDPSTISKEIKKHRIKKEGQSIHIGFNHCARRYNCHRKNICSTRCKKECRQCKDCNSVCPDFEDGICLRLKRAPFVCNGCSNRFNCRNTKYYYRALPSFNKYKDILSESRQGINMTELELSNLDKLISPLIKQGQSISHIYQTHDIPCSRSTLYRYLAKNCFSVGPLDLPRKVRMKKRKEKRTKLKDTKARTNRTYEDFQKYIELHPDLPIVEMDTVEGTKGGKVLLTLLFRASRLMLAFILFEKTQKEVLRVFNMLEHELGNELFEKTFPIILTDNGTEFGNPLSLEFNEDGIGRTRIFYCNPRASYQKGMIEKNHEFIRYVFPKGSSFDNLLQTDIDLMINHINSLGRNSLNWFAPIDVAKFTLDKEVLKKLNLKKIKPDEIQLNPKLLKKN